ncbi:MAG TPA: response regulator [Dehalococcoidia bacterium]|nr:response regulator [Dehalococcoidia bacterium]
MAFAPDTSGSGDPASRDPAPDFDLLRLSNLLETGIVRIDPFGSAWPLNETGARLLEMLGGSYGVEAPERLRQLLTDARSGLPAKDELLVQAPDLRHVAAVVGQSRGGGLVLLRDHTDERLLQERLLQSEKMASVGQLVSGVAHELNNPLTGVMGFAQLLLARDLDETVRGQIQTIYGEAERAAKIVQNLLSFARRRKPTKEMADMNSLLQRVLELRSYDFTARNIALDMTLDTRMERVWVDPDQIQQVLFNVIKNAEQAMVDAHGSGRLTVITRGVPDGVRVSIADDGPTIPPEVARRIFDPFFTTKDAGEGTGLGLTICYGIIDEHGGRIWTENLPPSIERPEGGGVAFNIELPVGVAEEQERIDTSSARPHTTPSAISGRRVLVVDDEMSIRALLHDILRLDQHSVALASSGVEAADLVERESFDVIITDMKMPGMDGAAFYHQVRQRDPAQSRRIIFITGDTVSPDTRAFLQRVSNPVLSKPFKIGPLRDAIESILALP